MSKRKKQSGRSTQDWYMTGPIIGTDTGPYRSVVAPQDSTKALPNYLPYSVQYCPFDPSFPVGVLCWCSGMQYHTERGRESRREVRLIRPSTPIMSSLARLATGHSQRIQGSWPLLPSYCLRPTGQLLLGRIWRSTYVTWPLLPTEGYC
jgi:hypothetical protein